MHLKLDVAVDEILTAVCTRSFLQFLQLDRCVGYVHTQGENGEVGGEERSEIVAKGGGEQGAFRYIRSPVRTQSVSQQAY